MGLAVASGAHQDYVIAVKCADTWRPLKKKKYTLAAQLNESDAVSLSAAGSRRVREQDPALGPKLMCLRDAQF